MKSIVSKIDQNNALDLSWKNISPKKAAQIAKFLCTNRTLHKLDLSGNNILRRSQRNC